MKISILLGSKALEYHEIKLDNAPRDIDIICDLDNVRILSWQATKKDGNLLFFGNRDEQLVLDVHLHSENSLTELIWNLVDKIEDKQYMSFNLGEELNNFQVLVLPLNWLHAITKGLLHRIPNSFSTQDLNIELWGKYMLQYQTIRKNYPGGYVALESEIDDSASIPAQLYKTQFDFIIEQLGDTFSLEQGETEFFDDNVKRYIDHDNLHEEVAIINRGVRDLLFKRYQKDPKSVEMDRDLFLADSRNNQINTIREELMVLYLERILIPDVVENDTHLNIHDYKRKFRNLVCHFICNLCGNGNYWLRKWCIDHYELFSDYSSYPLKMIEDFAMTFLQEGFLYDIPEKRILTLDDFLEYYKKYQQDIEDKQVYKYDISKGDFTNKDRTYHSNLTESSHSWYNIKGVELVVDEAKFETSTLCNINESHIQIDFSRIRKIWLNQINNNINGSIIDKVGNHIKEKIINKEAERTLDQLFNILIDGCGISYVSNESEIQLSSDKENMLIICVTSSYDDNNSYMVIYNAKNNLGLCFSFEEEEEEEEAEKNRHAEAMFFILEHSEIERDRIRFGTIAFSLNNISISNKLTDMYIDKRSCTYYISSCNGGSDATRDVSYMNSYGSSLPELQDFIEVLARYYLNIHEDESSNNDY